MPSPLCSKRCVSATKHSERGTQNSARFNGQYLSLWEVHLIVLLFFFQGIPIFLSGFLPEDKQVHSEELGTYLSNSFGNETRLDYGTGHETFIFIFFFCLREIGVVTPADLRALIISSFEEYLKTVRKLQLVYMLEPAGSHGVWGLDDYQCLVFLLGAAQVELHFMLHFSCCIQPS